MENDMCSIHKAVVVSDTIVICEKCNSAAIRSVKNNMIEYNWALTKDSDQIISAFAQSNQ